MKNPLPSDLRLWLIPLLIVLTAPGAFARPDQQILDREVSIDLENVPLSVALVEIETAAGVKFAYSSSQIDLDQIVSVRVKQKKLGLILNDLFGPLAIQYKVDERKEFILLKPLKAQAAPATQSQEHTSTQTPSLEITGRVTDAATQLPIAGVNIVVKGTTSGTTTDSDGKYVINVEAQATLIFSFIGYKTLEVGIAGRTVVDIVMEEDAAALKEVVVNAGYYLTTDKTKTGSIVRVSAPALENQPVTSPLMGLQGRLTGVDVTPNSGVPGAGPSIKIRGKNSLRFDGGYPLYVVDGVPVDPRPIESASVTVVGEYDPLGAIDPANIESIEILKDGDATSIYGSRAANGVVLITTKQGKTGKTNFDFKVYRGIGTLTNHMDLLDTRQYLAMRREAFKNNNQQTMTSGNAPDLVVWDTTRYTDWQKKLLGGKSHISNIQASISGGAKATSFLFGAGFHSETTIFPGDFGFQRATGHLNVNHQSLDEKFAASISASFGSTHNKFFNDVSVVNDALTLPPTAPDPYNEDGTLNWAPFGTAQFNSTWNNPMSKLRKTLDADVRNLIFNGNLSYKLAPGIALKANLGFTDLNGTEILKAPLNSFDPNFIPLITAQTQSGNNSRTSWIVEPQLSFLKMFHDHAIEALAGATWQQSENQFQQITASGYSSDALLGNVKGATSFFINVDDFAEYRYTAFFARIGYNWRQKYFVNLTGRRDGSSRFGPAHRFGTFGSIGAAWIFSNENLFVNHRSFLTFGKLRGSFGTTGNDQIGDYQYANTYSLTRYNFQGSVGLTPTALLNPDYAWEITRKSEAALELGMIQNRISLELSWYRNRSSNQLVQYQLPATTGFTSMLKNLAATVENSGWELTVTTKNFGERIPFRWITTFNLSTPRNKLIKFDDLENSPYANYYVVGEPLTIEKLYGFTGVDPQSGLYTFQDANNDKVINGADRVFLFNFGRNYYGGIENTFHYRSFELSILFQFANQNMKAFYSGRPGLRENQPERVFTERWTHEGDIASFQMLTTGSANAAAYNYFLNSDARIETGSFMRLKTLSLSYTISENIARKISAGTCKIFLQGQNVFTFTNNISLDPETGSFTVPPLKIITAGLQVQF